jgi:nicotinate-nucleotide pyrophosphorylase (carboxylating)
LPERKALTLKEFYNRYDKQITRAIRSALLEDRVKHDVTSNLLFKGKEGDRLIKAELLCKEDCIAAGTDIFKRVFKILYPKSGFRNFYKEGDRVRNKSVVLEISAPLRVLLEGERTSLNFIQRMSGIAALTNEFVRKLKFRGSKILHTRKTTPNFRLFELAAVKTGGGDFHRMDLSSSVMIKDNHIQAIGSLQDVLETVRHKKLSSSLSKRFEVEVKSLRETELAVKAKDFVEIVMLDNFPPRQIQKAVKLLKKNGIKVELSGGINLSNFDKLQVKGIDYYSIGMLTHSYKSADFSLEF